MKSLRLSLAVLVASFAFAGLVRAEDKKPAGTPGKCCAKASADGKDCKHPCCTAAAKDGKNCEKCGGSNEATAEKKS